MSRFYYIAAFATWLFLTGAGNAKDFTVYTTPMGAYSKPLDASSPGMMVELVQAMALEANLSTTVSLQPWKRAINTVASDKEQGLIFPLIRSPARETEFAWVVEVLHDRKVFICRQDHNEKSTKSELETAKIGVIRGSPFDSQLQRLNYQGLDAAGDGETNARKLAKKRIDYWYVTYNTAMNTFDELGMARDQFKVCHANEHIPIYMAGNKSFAKDTAKKLQAAFTKLKDNGFVEQLLKKYKMTDAGEGPGRTSQVNP